MDEFDSNTTPDNESQNEQHTEGSSRRTFLKAAVVGSAAAVAVSGVGAATLTLTGHHTGLKKYLALTTDTISGVTGKSCTTTSGDKSQDAFGTDTIFLWAKFNGVPAGTYTIGVASFPDSHVDYRESGNNAFIYNYPGGDSSFDCNPPASGGQAVLPAELAHSHTEPITFTTPSDGDVLFLLHMAPLASGTDSLTVTLYEGTTTSGTVVEAVTSNSFTIS